MGCPHLASVYRRTRFRLRRRAALIRARAVSSVAPVALVERALGLVLSTILLELGEP